MVVLCIGDIVGNPGIECLERLLAPAKRRYGANMVVVNGENCANAGVGINAMSLARLVSAGADVVTTGNHAFRSPGYEELFEQNANLVRPLNLPVGVSGRGSCVFDLGHSRVRVVSLMGQSFMGVSVNNPYDAMDTLLKEIDETVVLVDFHAESSSEKAAFAMNYAGRVSAVVGTHTHVQTADERILGEKTGFITDLGMTGPLDSVIGVDPAGAIKKQRYGVPVRFSVAAGPTQLCGAVLEIDTKSGHCTAIERIAIE